MPSLIHIIGEKFFSLLFPDRCVGCKKYGELLCNPCLAKSRRKSNQKRPGSYLDRFYSWGAYEDKILREALRRFKYHGTYGFAHPFSAMLHDLIKPFLSSLPGESIVVPIPMDPARKRERGYNQAELLAEKFSEKISLPLAADVLQKIKITPSQTSLSREERILNIKDSFGISNQEKIRNKNILLVDDISTTGATLNEAARVLKDAGAREVIGLVVARG